MFKIPNVNNLSSKKYCKENGDLLQIFECWIQTDKERFYKVYSPEKFKLAPREDIYLDFKFAINTSPGIELWVNLLPSLKGIGLKLESQDWVSNKTKGNTIPLPILNRSFTYTTRIKKNQCIGFIFLLGEKLNDAITTKYNTLC